MVIEIEEARIVSVTPGGAEDDAALRGATTAARGRGPPPRGPHAAGPGERALARVPARAARPHARGHRARSGPGASRCTRWPARSIPTAASPSRARPSARWRWPASPASASSTTCTTRPTARPTTTRTRWAAPCWRRPPTRGSGSRCSTRATCTAASTASATRRGRWAERVDQLEERPTARVGAAIHSVRAVDPESARTVAEWAAGRPCTPTSRSSRRRTRSASRPTAAPRPGCWPTPARCRSASPRSTPRTCTDDDVALLGEAGVTACLCPTTERDLADGIGPARRLLDAGVVARHRQRLAGGDRPVRGGPRDRARRAARDRRPRRASAPPTSCARRRRAATPRSAGPRAAASRPARSPTSPPSRSTACASPAPTGRCGAVRRLRRRSRRRHARHGRRPLERPRRRARRARRRRRAAHDGDSEAP